MYEQCYRYLYEYSGAWNVHLSHAGQQRYRYTGKNRVPVHTPQLQRRHHSSKEIEACSCLPLPSRQHHHGIDGRNNYVE